MSHRRVKFLAASASSAIFATLAVASIAGCSSTPDEGADVATLPLNYEVTRWIPELSEKVTIVKSPYGSRVQRASGEWQAFSEFSTARERAAQRLDSVHPDLRARIESSEDGDSILGVALLPVAARPTSGAEEVSVDLEVTPQESALRTAIASSGETGEAQSRRLSRFLPIYEISAPARVWRRWLRDKAFASIADAVMLSVDGKAVGEAFIDQDPTSVLKSDVVFNSNGNYGKGTSVGMIETGFNGGRVFTKHEAFTYSGIVHQVAPTNCATTNECVAADCPNCECIDGYCTGGHATAVASVISHTKSGVAHNAAAANIYVANRGMVCNLGDYVGQLDWLISKDVHLVTETFRCSDGTGTTGDLGHGYLQDYYARYMNMLFLDSAGNKNSGEHDQACTFTPNALSAR